MSQKFPSQKKIERWSPPSLRYVVGCSALKKHFRKMLEADGFGPNTLITGDTGTGKKTIVRAYIQTLLCPNRDNATLDKCGQCEPCKQGYRSGLRGSIPSAVLGGVLCGYMMQDIGGVTVVYFDDIHQAQPDYLASVVKAIEEAETTATQNFVWIATALSASELSKPFLKRFAVVLSTSSASHEEFILFLHDLCGEWELNARDNETVIILAELSKLIPRSAIGFLATVAGKEDRAFDETDVERYFLHQDEQNA